MLSAPLAGVLRFAVRCFDAPSHRWLTRLSLLSSLLASVPLASACIVDSIVKTVNRPFLRCDAFFFLCLCRCLFVSL